MPEDSPGGGLRYRRPEPGDLRAPVAGDPGEVQESDLLQRLLWEAYREVIPEEQHEATGKGEGETFHVERWINTLRQRLSRFVRKTLSFSKSRQMHHCCLKLFIHRYNLERQSIILG
jgi:IS1 transposase